MAKFIVSYLVSKEFDSAKDAIDAVSPETTEVREVTDYGSYGVNIEDLRKKVYPPAAAVVVEPTPKEEITVSKEEKTEETKGDK